MTELLAQCTGLRRSFGHFAAVSGVDLRLHRGEVVGLLGANGAGKTTLIRLLLGLLPASGGDVRLFGEPPSRRTRQRIGYVPQGLGLYDDLTVAENMAFSAAVFGQSARRALPEPLRAPGNRALDQGAAIRAIPGKAEEGASLYRLATDENAAGGSPGAAFFRGPRENATAFSRGGIPAVLLPGALRPYARVLAGSLPLGIQRGVAFAQALAHRPDLLVLDEPTSGVGPLARARLWETVAEATVAGAGVLVTTHYMDEAAECDRLMIMAEGAVVAEGRAGEIIGDARVTVVEAPSWAPAFEALEAAGLPVALAGTTLRVPGAAPAAIRQALGQIEARVTQAPATLEERFFQLTPRVPGNRALE